MMIDASISGSPGAREGVKKGGVVADWSDQGPMKQMQPFADQGVANCCPRGQVGDVNPGTGVVGRLPG